jgi:hypothetical protein
VWNGASREGVSRSAQLAAIEHTIRHATLRGVGFIGLLAVALIHLLDVFSKFSETPYLGVMYIVLMLSSIVVAFALLHTGRPVAWMAAGALAAATLIGFILSRTTGLPSSTGDVGNWKEPLGVASVFVESAVILLSGYALAIARREHRPGVHEALPLAE